MFANPQGKSKATISSRHLWLISLSNKLCVGLDVYERQEKKKIPAVMSLCCPVSGSA